MIETKKLAYNLSTLYNVVIYTPDGIDKPVPAVFFIPGSGEGGTDANKLYTYGPLKFIKDGWKPDFIVIGMQPINDKPTGYKITLDCIKKTIIENPLADKNRWYMTGLSYGAATVFDYMRNTPDADFIAPAAIAPMSITIDAQCGNFYNSDDALCKTDFRYEKVAAWGFCGKSDSHFAKMSRFFLRLISAKYDAKWTAYEGGHGGWNTYYDSKGALYPWLLSKSKSTETIPVPMTYQSTAMSQQFNRNDCGESYAGSAVTYLVAQGKFTSEVSQADADKKAKDDLAANGQNYSNKNGTCTLIRKMAAIITVGNFTFTLYDDGTATSIPILK